MSIGSAMRGENVASLLLRLLHQPGENTVIAAMPAGERLCCARLGYVLGFAMCLALPVGNKRVCSSCQLLQSSSSLLAGALPPLVSVDSADSVNSKITGTVNRMKSNTIGMVCRIPSRQRRLMLLRRVGRIHSGWGSLRFHRKEEASGHHVVCGTL